MKIKQPQVIAAVALVLLVVIGGGIFAMTRGGNQQPTEEIQQQKKKKISQPVNQIDVSERPYVQIDPLADGRNLDLKILDLKKAASAVEYELEYQAGSLLQGAFGLIELDTVPAEARILLGSCSAGGSCTYHEDVQGGSLVLRFEGPEEYALKQDWRYFDNWGNTESEFASKDAKFQVESTVLGQQRFVIIYNSPGYPEGVEGNVVSEIYSLAGSSPLTGTADISIRANEEGNLTIWGYDGTTWQSFETTSDGKLATAEVELMELYLVTTE